MKGIASLLLFLLFAGIAFSQGSAKAESKEIITWLQQKAISIKHAEAGNDFSDLRPLQQILKDVRIVGLGENTHGTREFFQLKHRLLEYLVKDMNFTGFAIEGGYGSCEPINNYVLYGKGDLSSALTAQGYVLWDMEELAEMIEWMRTYNQSVPDEKKVAFHGIDFMYNEPAREKVLTYLEKYGAEVAPAADSLFVLLSLQEKQWGKEKDKKLLSDARLRLQHLIAYLTKNENALKAASSTAEFAQILKCAQVMEQWFMLHLPDSSDTTSTTNMKRSQAMANNLLYLIENEKPNTKFVVWAHNVHTADGHSETAEPNLGHLLKRKLGDAYYGVAFEFNQGSYQSRLRSQGILGNLKVMPVAPAPEGYLASYLSQVKKDILFLNLRDSTENAIVSQWLNQPQKIRSFGWFNDNTSNIDVYLKSRYDGVIFIEHTTATRPTKNALSTVSKGEGL
jgi:erythromycin esterase